MLVLASDLHLTDGSSGTTINASAFGEFANSVTQMVEKAQAKRLEIVFLGDVIDMIRSAVWLGTSRFALRLSERLPLGTLARVLENPLLTAFQGQSTLIDRASQEKVFQEGQTDFVV